MDPLFKKHVYEIIELIPSGRLTSYGAIARAVGYPNHSRQVGNALRDYPDSFPAHRVCSSSGHITASCLDRFKANLKSEGVSVEGTKIIDFKNLFWDPVLEL